MLLPGVGQRGSVLPNPKGKPTFAALGSCDASRGQLGNQNLILKISTLLLFHRM